MRWAGHVARIGERRGIYRVLVRKPEGKRPLGRPKFRWEDNIKMSLYEVGWGRGMDLIDLGQDRMVAASCTRDKDPSGSVKFEELLD
jgi:hypothetical protein